MKTGATCPTPVVRKRTIIESEDSIRSGAQLIGSYMVENAGDCYERCCDDYMCNAAIIHYKEETFGFSESVAYKFCFLFSCGNPSVCSYRYHRRYALIDFGSRTNETKLKTTPRHIQPVKSTTTEIQKNFENSTVKSTPLYTNVGKYKSSCHVEIISRSEHMPEVFVPECNNDGSYKSRQCNVTRGDCWCVNTTTGLELHGSRQMITDGIVECVEQWNSSRTKNVLNLLSLEHNEQSLTITDSDYDEEPVKSLVKPALQVESDPYYTGDRREW